MKQEVKERNSSFELMRIVSMLMIVLWHFIIHSKFYYAATGGSKVLILFISSLLMVHVNSFVLLSGYYQCTNKLKLSKVLKLNNSIWFYKFSITLILVLLNLIEISKVSLIKTALPISYDDYWFFTMYFALYLISPILNVTINNCSKQKMKKIIILLFIIFDILPTLTTQKFFNVSGGYSLYNFILLYFIGAYIRKYPIDKNYFMKYFTDKSRKIVLLFLFFIFAIINYLLVYFGEGLLQLQNTGFKEIGSILSSAFLNYSNPLVMFQSISYFLFFSLLTIKSKKINRIAVYTFGVYLISDNISLKGFIYKLFKLDPVYFSFKTIPYIFVCTIIVFVVCIIIEAIRQLIFKLIYNTKLAKKNREKCQSFIKSLGIEVNW